MQIKPAACLIPVLSLAVLLGGCGKESAPAAQQQQAEVGVVKLEAKPVTLSTELPGRTSAFRVAEVRPQVSGVLLKRTFVEGGEVKAGQQLYQIDPRTYEAAYNSAKAALDRAEATLASNRLKAERYDHLVAVQAISRQEADDARALLKQNQADVASAKAEVESARINLAYTKVAAPISGQIGRSLITEGGLVQAGQTTALASINQLDPIYVDVTQSSTEMLRLRTELAAGKLQKAADGSAQVKLVLEDGSEYGQAGKLQFSEVSVDQGTGSVTIRAEFPNPDKLLLPGMFVRAKLEEGVRQNAIMAPQQGITRDMRGQAVAMVVSKDGKVEQRSVVTDRAIGDQWLVNKGLEPGDQIITEGLQKIRPGMPVKAVPASNVNGVNNAGAGNAAVQSGAQKSATQAQ